MALVLRSSSTEIFCMYARLTFDVTLEMHIGEKEQIEPSEDLASASR